LATARKPSGLTNARSFFEAGAGRQHCPGATATPNMVAAAVSKSFYGEVTMRA
jgi:hypothetical protein